MDICFLERSLDGFEQQMSSSVGPALIEGQSPRF